MKEKVLRKDHDPKLIEKIEEICVEVMDKIEKISTNHYDRINTINRVSALLCAYTIDCGLQKEDVKPFIENLLANIALYVNVCKIEINGSIVEQVKVEH